MSSTSAATSPNKSRGAVLASKNGKLKIERGDRRVEYIALHSTVVARADTAQGNTTAYEAQIENLKQVAALLRAELADMRAQRDEWRARAERKSLAASIAVASRARSFWRRT
jgi:hypothetical protein